MLTDAQSLRAIRNPRHPDTWNKIIGGTRKLTPVEFTGVITGIDRLMIATHDKVTVPGFKAQSNWSGLPWDILFWKCANHDERMAAWMLGLMAQYAFIHHPLHWYTDRTTYPGRDFPNAFYFQGRYPYK